MAPRTSAGLLIFRVSPPATVDVLLGHYGGPFWAGRDDGAWTVFKGEPHPGESLRDAAAREFEEETGWRAPSEHWLALPRVTTPRQIMTIWAVRSDFDPADLRPGDFALEWPPRSGRIRRFPEIDRARWFPLETARSKVPAGQRILLDHLTDLVGAPPDVSNPDG